jgi:hypothetical protein
LNVEIYLPHQESALFEQMAAQLGLDEESFASRVTGALDSLEGAWKTARHELQKGGSIRVRGYSHFSRYTLVVTDRHAVVALPQTVDETPGDEPGAAITFQSSTGEFPRKWLRNQFDRLNELADQFADDL